MLGYLFGVPVAVIAGFLAVNFKDYWQHLARPPSSANPEMLALLVVLICINCVTALAPFLLVRKIAGVNGFKTSWRCCLWCAVVALATLPVDTWIARGLNIEGPNQPYFADLGDAFAQLGIYCGLGGLIGGLVFWLLEISSLPVRWARFAIRVLTCRVADGHARSFTPRSIIEAAFGWIATAVVVVGTIIWLEPLGVWTIGGTTAGGVKIRHLRELDNGGFLARWSPDGTMLAYYGSNDVNLETEYGQILWRRKRQFRFPAVAPLFSHDGRSIVVSDLGSPGIAFSVLDVTTGNVLKEVQGRVPGESNFATSLAMSPDGSLMAVTFRRDKSRAVAIYQTRDWSVDRFIDDGAADSALPPAGAAFSPDGRRLAYTRISKLLIADVGSGVIERRIVMPGTIYPPDVMFSPDGEMVAVITAPLPPGGAIRVYRVSDGQQIALLALSSRPVVATWDPRGRFICLLDDIGFLHIWSPLQPDVRDTLIPMRLGAFSVAITSDGNQMAVVNGGMTSIFALD